MSKEKDLTLEEIKEAVGPLELDKSTERALNVHGGMKHIAEVAIEQGVGAASEAVTSTMAAYADHDEYIGSGSYAPREHYDN